MRQSVPILTGLALLVSPVGGNPAAQSGWNYDACTAMAEEAPQKALERGEKWAETGGGFAARHCVTLALVNLDRPAEAAKRLQKLRQAMAAKSAAPKAQRAAILGQEGNAWLLADMPEKAYVALSEGLSLLPEKDPARVDLLLDRARAQAAMDRDKRARADLDAAIALAPERSDLRIYRAAALRRLDRIDAALKDIEIALKIAPDNPRALLERGVLRYMTDDAEGARRDWRRVLKHDPGPETEQAARHHLKRTAPNDSADKKPAAGAG